MTATKTSLDLSPQTSKDVARSSSTFDLAMALPDARKSRENVHYG